MVGVGVYFCRSRCQVTDSIQEVADITLADYKQFPHCWFIPADSVPPSAGSPLNPGPWKTICDTISQAGGKRAKGKGFKSTGNHSDKYFIQSTNFLMGKIFLDR